MVFLNGKIAGLDFVSRKETYKDVHNKILQSHVIEALADEKEVTKSLQQMYSEAEDFLSCITQASYSKHPSVGLGTDCRMEDEKCGGAALIHDTEVIHLTAFSADMVDNRGRKYAKRDTQLTELQNEILAHQRNVANRRRSSLFNFFANLSRVDRFSAEDNMKKVVEKKMERVVEIEELF